MYNESLKSKGHQYEHSVLLRKPAAASVLPLSNWAACTLNGTAYLVQPSVVRLAVGKPQLRVFYRDRRAAWIYSAASEDDGFR